MSDKRDKTKAANTPEAREKARLSLLAFHRNKRLYTLIDEMDGVDIEPLEREIVALEAELKKKKEICEKVRAFMAASKAVGNVSKTAKKPEYVDEAKSFVVKAADKNTLTYGQINAYLKMCQPAQLRDIAEWCKASEKDVHAVLSTSPIFAKGLKGWVLNDED